MKRNLVNLMMLILFMLTMSFYFLPKVIHEILGILWLVAVLLHLFLNRSWFAALGRGRWTASRTVSVFVSLSLMTSMVAVMVTGVFISNHLFKGWFGMELARSITVHQLHVSLPFLLMILMGIHLGLHWKGLWQRILERLPVDPSSGRARIASYLCAAGLLAVGVYGSFLHRVGDRLLMKHIFGTKATELPLGMFLLLLLGILGIYVIAGYEAQKLLNLRRGHRA